MIRAGVANEGGRWLAAQAQGPLGEARLVEPNQALSTMIHGISAHGKALGGPNYQYGGETTTARHTDQARQGRGQGKGWKRMRRAIH